jgi:hypothetical protein
MRRARNGLLPAIVAGVAAGAGAGAANREVLVEPGTPSVEELGRVVLATVVLGLAAVGTVGCELVACEGVVLVDVRAV